VREFFASIAFIAFGLLAYKGAGWFAHFFSDAADRWERDGVIRGGGKVWRDDSPRMFAFRVQNTRFSAAFAGLALKALGAIFVILGISRIFGWLIR